MCDEQGMEKFIALVMEYPYLYDKSKSEFKDSKLKDKMWVKIGEEFGKTGEEAKSYFKSLREKFIRIKKQKEKDTRSGAGALKEKDWPFYNLMFFLDEVIRPRKTKSNFMNQSSPLTPLQINIDTDQYSNADSSRASTPFSPMEFSFQAHTTEIPIPEELRREHEVDPLDRSTVSSVGSYESRSTFDPPKKRTKDNFNSKVSLALEAISSNLTNLEEPKPKEITATGAFCQYLKMEMDRLPEYLREELKDEIMFKLIEKRKEARYININRCSDNDIGVSQ